MSGRKVDVLKLMNAEISRYEMAADIDAYTGSEGCANRMRSKARSLIEARAAVADLIEAANASLQANPGAAQVAANLRLIAALANIGPTP